MSFGTLLETRDVPAVEAAETLQRNENSSVADRSFGAHFFCEVRVHRITGAPRVTRWLPVIDAGRITNPKSARSQIVGAVHNATGKCIRDLPITMEKLIDGARPLYP